MELPIWSYRNIGTGQLPPGKQFTHLQQTAMCNNNLHCSNLQVITHIFMSDSTVLSLNQLPPEILHSIFHHLDIPDILRLRRVSHTFHASNLALNFKSAGLSIPERKQPLQGRMERRLSQSYIRPSTWPIPLAIHRRPGRRAHH